MKKCIISLGINSEPPEGHPPKKEQDFPKGIRRIRRNLKSLGFDGKFIGWDRKYPRGAPTFAEVPYAAKPFCFLEARRKGFDQVLWVDASIRFKQSPDPLFDIIEQRGYLLVENTHSIGMFCSDAAAETLGLDREKSFSLPCCKASLIGLDFRRENCRDLLTRWHEKALDGVTFHGAKWSGTRGYPATASKDPRVMGHRHDQTALASIAHDLGMTDWMSLEEIEEYSTNRRRFVRSYDEPPAD